MAEKKDGGDVKVGLGVEEWLDMWEGDWDEETSQEGEDTGGQSSNEPQSCSDTGDSEFDEKGNKIKVDASLIKYLDRLTGGRTDHSIFVSLCGDSLDMEWLCSKGYEVVGAELSETAAKRAFERPKSPVSYEVITDGNMKVYSATDGKKLKIYVGNFFDDAINPTKLGTFHCIWDCHGIVSLPVAQHESYAKKLLTFLKPGGKMLFSTVDYDVSKLKSGSAPAPVLPSTLQGFYPQCTIEVLESFPLPSGQLDGIDSWTNPITLISTTQS